MNNMPTNSLIENYLPADYMDSYSKEITCKQRITPEMFHNLTFSQLPKWIELLMNLRNVIVKPFGIDTNSKFTNRICDKSPNEEIFGMSDKHLNFHISMWCGEFKENKQELRITTVVNYNNTFGKLYFSIIKSFHRIIILSILKSTEQKLSKTQE